MYVEEGQLGDFLVDRGLLSRRQVEEALRQAQGKSLYTTLGEMGVVDEDELRRAAAHALGVPFVQFLRHEIDPEAMMQIPEPLSRAHQLLAYRVSEDGLEVAALNLESLKALEPLALSHRVLPRLTTRESLTHGLLHYQKILKEKFSALLTHGSDVVEALVHHALLSRAHGVHLDLNTTGTLVRYRVGHALEEAMELPAHIGAALAGKLKLLAKFLPDSRTVQEGRFRMEKDGPSTKLGTNERYVVHVSASPQAAGERLVLRLAKESAGHRGFALETLGLHGKALEDLHAALAARSGLIIVAGPLYSGKTTLLYTLLDLLNTPSRSVVTVESAVEHRLSHVLHMQTDPAAGLDAAAVLRAALRQDPDVVMVDDVQDSRVAALAASAASRGVLVLAGVTAHSAAGALAMLQELGVPPLVLASSVRAAVATWLVEKLCQHCGQAYYPSRAQLVRLEEAANLGAVLAALKEEGVVAGGVQWKELEFKRTKGCAECAEGYEGLVGLKEVLPVTEPIKELMLKGSWADLTQEAREEGMLTLLEDGLFKAAQGITTIEAVAKLLEA